MTVEDDGPTTEAELLAALRSLLRQAHANGVEVEGGWACPNGADHPAWDVVVTEVESQIGQE